MLNITNRSEPLARDSKAAMVQVGWVGQTGKVYELGTPLSEIHKIETASYAPLYMQLGEWEYHEPTKKWFVEEE